MKALVCVAPNEARIEERARPVAGQGEVLLRIRRVGVCGTDFHIFTGKQPFFTYPRLIGHELAGEVVEASVGSDLAIGQVVTVNPYIPCGTCVACRRQRPNCCARVSVLGVHADGGMAEYLAVPSSAIIPTPGLTVDQAAMVEFLAIGAHAVRRAAIAAGSRVLVTGAGPIGIACAMFARIAGAGSITLLDRSDARLAKAVQDFGFGSCVTAGPDATVKLAEISDGEMFDYVFDATGSAAAMNAGLANVAHAGTYILVGLCLDNLVFADPEFHKRETTLLASRNALHADFELVIDSIRNGTIPTDRMLTHRIDLADLATDMPSLLGQQEMIVKAIVTV
ncbi:2-desacetyl-2-hydroxyethyl bacteriochlorophyllide A dehydrogenase [Sphingobium xenophagum]|uniref:2-desacetyl-2-hydroxyethyl bacteriochlorophyllide A dehydrogenase n=1 Tax=Sphingobium xenophagum TaxID=121428 RepID=A0ABU1X611_SPHXE|nr:zinc-binding alcohol dehydrogenase family protein [Sphingobium xenophagum]MDR7156929.1 2-desacetyl-2-hydroxyethyl bacteriochlorophyllide A dehydrogenase [Sphingobium xenophagum]